MKDKHTLKIKVNKPLTFTKPPFKVDRPGLSNIVWFGSMDDLDKWLGNESEQPGRVTDNLKQHGAG